MQLNALTQINQNLNEQKNHRTQKADALFNTGYQILIQAQEHDFEDKQLTVQGLQHITESIRFNRKDVRPYLIMAYLLIAHGDDQRAQRYLVQVLKLEPNHPQALNLLAVMKNEHPTHTSEPLKNVDDEELLEQKMDQVKIRCEALHPVFKRLISVYTPGIDMQAAAQYQSKLRELQEELMKLQADTESIGNDGEIQSIYQNLEALEHINKRAQSLLHATQKMIKIQRGIQQELDTIEQLFPMGLIPANAEVLIESLLDHCDTLANRIDELDESYHLDPLISRYEAYVEQLEKIQDQIDA